MREEELAAAVHPLHDRLVVLVVALVAEAHQRKMTGSAYLPARFVADPALEQLGEPDRLADSRLQALASVTTQNRPELERAEPAPEGRAVLGEAVDLLARPQIFRHEAERTAQVLRSACPEQRAVHWREQPFVCIDDQ